MTLSLFLKAVSAILLGVPLLGLFLFLPAGTLAYPKAWLLLGILFIPMCFVGIFLMIKNPALLEKRLRAKEEQGEQRTVIALSALMFISGFILAGLDFRLGWLPLPNAVSIVAAGVFLLAYGMYFEVMRENAYLSRTIEIQDEQTVVDTGLYGIIRHPMYSATLLLFLSMPLVLGSFVSLIVFLAYPVIIAKRIRNEEEVLEAGLKGYSAYKQSVQYRLIPFIW